MNALLTAILKDEASQVATLLRSDPSLAGRGVERDVLYESGILHWLYAGDTPLHLAAAGHRERIVGLLLKAGADPNAAANRRRGRPLHYAADGSVQRPEWDPARQVATLKLLLSAGAELEARDLNGATPLHRAVRTRSAAAVRLLLDRGADPTARNGSGSTPFHLAVQCTGRGGSGGEIGIAAQREILRAFMERSVSTAAVDGRGRSVLECATSDWIRTLLSGADPGEGKRPRRPPQGGPS